LPATKWPPASEIESIALRLGNTVSVCRKCYVHPAVLEHYMHGAMAKTGVHISTEAQNESSTELRKEERAVIRLLQQRIAA
jgi:DNA topoisomerase I